MATTYGVAHVVDDEPEVLESIRHLLIANCIESIGYSSAEAFLEQFDGTGPGCLITDLRLPGMDGLRLIEQVRQRFPVLPTIVMTGYGDINKARSAMKRQAIEFLQKPFNPADLCSTARAAIVASRQLSRTAHLSPDTRLSKLLTPREYQVFNLIVDGFNTHQMSEALGISNRTVESHRANLRHKLGAESVADLVLFHSYCRH